MCVVNPGAADGFAGLGPRGVDGIPELKPAPLAGPVGIPELNPPPLAGPDGMPDANPDAGGPEGMPLLKSGKLGALEGWFGRGGPFGEGVDAIVCILVG